jgi:hypothetical protein
MTTWNYRVIRKSETETSPKYLEIHEVYYDDTGKPVSVTMEGITPYADDIDALASELRRMSEALTKPVLDYSDFDK